MKAKTKKFLHKLIKYKKDPQRGSAIIIATLILALIAVYVSTSLTLATSDAISSSFEETQRRGYYTAFSKLEQMSRDFSGLFANSLNPSYDSMCRVVVAPGNLAGLTSVNKFNISLPNVNCSGANCVASYTGKLSDAGNVGSDLYDLGWVGQSINPAIGFCVVDVCNPTAGTNCMIPARPPNAIKVNTGDYNGLQGFARRYRQVARAINPGGVDVQITRDFDNILLPLFQFGIFSDSDFELYIPPNWAFGGWAHSNGNFYLTNTGTAGSIKFSQYDSAGLPTPARITAGKHMILGNEKTGRAGASSMQIYTSAGYTTISQGDVLNGANINCPSPSGNGIGATATDPTGSGCTTFTGTSGGEIKLGVKALKLPIQSILGANPIELIKRGLATDYAPTISSPLISARYFFKPGIRITLADYQSQLPRTVVPGDSDPTMGTGPYGGIQLDGPDPILGMVGAGATKVIAASGSPAPWYYQKQSDGKVRPIPRGYQPKVITGTPRPTGARVNGFRLHGWIKVELVRTSGQTNDITEEMLNLGVTVPYMANRAGAFYYPRATPGFPSTTYLTAPLPYNDPGPYPDENSIIHLQRMAVPYTPAQIAGLLVNLPGTLAQDVNLLPQGLDNVTSSVSFDYYASMALGSYNENVNLKMYGIEDNVDGASYTTNLAAGVASYAEPQKDKSGYYTDVVRTPLPVAATVLTKSQIDFSASSATPGTVRTGANFLSENANLPKSSFLTATGPAATDVQAILYNDGETTWSLNDSTTVKHRLVPFPINLFDSREGTPHQTDTVSNAQANTNGAAAGVNNTDAPVPGIGRTSVSKVGTMNLVEIDMGNLGRLLNGDFNTLFSQMGNTAFFASQGHSFTGMDVLENIVVNQDNGWLVYISDRRGDEPVVKTNPYFPTVADLIPVIGKPSLYGNGEYHRENVIWSTSGNTTTGNEAGILPTAGAAPCTVDGKDDGKSPQDTNNNCQIDSEVSTLVTPSKGYSETADYSAYFQNSDQIDPTIVYATPAPTATLIRDGNMIGLTEVPTNPVSQATWSLKPPVLVETAPNLRMELFRRAVRLVNAANLFPTGQAIVVNTCGARYGISVSTENPVYVFGNYNAPAGNYPTEGVNDLDSFPGVTVTPVTTAPTSSLNYAGANFNTCANGCHVPAAIIADAITMLSGANVGTSNANWSQALGYAGWLDSRSFISPYQAIGYRPARNTAYRFALISGYTPSWYDTYWGSGTNDQGGSSDRSSGALNNFPRFLEDWGPNVSSNANSVLYSGSLIRIYKSRQANGAFKRGAGSVIPNIDYVYRPPNRDWIFDTDFYSPCTLPPGSPFLQLLDFKGFQESVIQR